MDPPSPDRARLAAASVAGLGSNEDLFWTLSAHTPVGIFVSDPTGACVFVNARWCELTGLSSEQAHGDGWSIALHPEDAERVRGEWAEAAAAGRDSIVEYRFRRPDGTVSWIQGFASAFRDTDGCVAGWVGTCLDLTAQKAVERELQQLADHDPLTGLLNCRCFNDELEREAARIRRHDGAALVLMIDLDHFKAVNDTYGHRAGDDVLCAVARLLHGRLRVTDVLARVGGDEFAIIAPGNPAADQADTLVRDLVEAIRVAKIATCKTTISITASIGVATLDPDNAGSADDVLVAADEAMYQAKRAGRNQIATAA